MMCYQLFVFLSIWYITSAAILHYFFPEDPKKRNIDYSSDSDDTSDSDSDDTSDTESSEEDDDLEKDPDYVPDEDEESSDDESSDDEDDDDETLKIPDVCQGDIISMTFRSMRFKDFKNKNMRRIGRAISNYGCFMITPEENKKYKVMSVVSNSYIPNGKGDSVKERIPKLIHLYPLEVNLDNEFDNDSAEVFWYINLSDNTICQYEDGFPLYMLTSLKVVNI